MDWTKLSFRDFLAYKVKKDKDSIAIVDKDVPYTWADIDAASSMIAADLAGIGVSKRSRVALCATNGIGFVVTFFAIQKLGAIALLINPLQTAEETGVTAQVGDATHFAYGKTLPMDKDPGYIEKVVGCTALSDDKFYDIREAGIRERIDGYDGAAELPDVAVESDDVAVMIFTSGSTGRPKGVMHSAYNIMNAAIDSMETQTLKADDRTCLILPLFHIFGMVAGLFANSIAGSTIYIPGTIHAMTVMDLIDRYKCTIFHAVPTMLIAMVNNDDFDPQKVVTLRCTIISGAAATPAQIRLFKKMMPNNHFLSAYGLSEMAPVSTSRYEDTDEHLLDTVGLVGKGVSVRIIDQETKKDCPIGMLGEIIVKSTSLMTGYYKVAADDQAIDEEGWIHTADLGYMRKDGYLCLSGRLKDIIIRGGENIMPAQVESAISSFDIIDNVRVLGVPSEFFGEEVAACIILKSGADFDEDKFRKALSGKLARFRMPTYIEIYDRFPLLGSGKIDNVKLKEDLIRRVSRHK